MRFYQLLVTEFYLKVVYLALNDLFVRRLGRLLGIHIIKDLGIGEDWESGVSGTNTLGTKHNNLESEPAYNS